jgi:hypothetical protein
MARPNAGYTAKVWDYGPDQVVVYFYNRDTVYEVRAYANGSSSVKKYSRSSR